MASETPRGINDPTLPATPAPTARNSGGRMPDRYQVRAQLGAGGMGEVVLATDTQIGRDVAIKRMTVEPSAMSTARFVREAKIQGKLDHPAIVPVHELGADGDGAPFFVMKRLAGTTLAAVIATNAKTRAKLLRAFADVCLAVELAHTRGIVHRDLKPANIMLGDFGEVYVLDWGIARIVGDTDDGEALVAHATGTPATEVGDVLGTPGYIAPEVEAGAIADARADVYGLGCVLFEILVGEPVGRIVGGVRPSVRAPDRDVPPELDQLCADALATDPTQRVPTARVLAERVERYLDGDRDAALRKQLASAHLDAARRALAAGDGETERAEAMREAGRALALDPTSGAAELIGALVLRPSGATPREVDARIADSEGETAREKARGSAFVTIAYFAFLPALLWIGFRDLGWLGAFVLVCGIDAVYAFVLTRGRRPFPPASAYGALAFNAVVMALFSRMFSPLLVAPAMTAVTMMIFAIDVRLKMHVLLPLSLAGVFVPWLLEAVGLIGRTLSIQHGDLVIHSPAVVASDVATEVSLALFVAVLVVFSGYISRRAGVATRAALHRTELQAWHLRQLAR